MTDENTYTAPEGTKYRATSPDRGLCLRCHFYEAGETELCADREPNCLAKYRADKRDIIWIKESP